MCPLKIPERMLPVLLINSTTVWHRHVLPLLYGALSYNQSPWLRRLLVRMLLSEPTILPSDVSKAPVH